MGNNIPPVLTQEPQSEAAALRELTAGSFTSEADALRLMTEGEGYRLSEQAQSFGQAAGYFGLSVAKSFADSTAHLGVLGAKTLAGTSSFLHGEGFDAGWDEIEQVMRSQTGTTDPDSFDIVHSLGKKLGAFNETDLNVGSKTDEVIQRRLGNWAVLSNTIGGVASFATGAPANVGKAAATAIRPATDIAERVLAKTAGARVATGAEIDTLLAQGRVWEWMATNPSWQATASIRERLLALGGRNLNDLMGITAANVAQSYGVAPDDQRARGAAIAAETSWLMVPIARLGQRLAGMIAVGGMDAEQALAAKLTYDRLADGRISLQEADAAFKEILPGGMRMAAANLVSSAFEGTAFLGLSPDAHDLFQRGLQGDSDAWAQLAAMALGTPAGIAVMKHAVPQDLAPMFKNVRPDLNRLDTFIEAEANKRAAADAAKLQESQDAQQRQAALDAYEAEAQARYRWADPHTVAALRAGWAPSFQDASGATVGLKLGRDFEVVLSREGEGFSVILPERTAAALKDVGIAHGYEAVPGMQEGEPGGFKATGELAVKVLDDLALLATARGLQGDLTYTRLGFREVAPGADGELGIWADDTQDKHYKMQLDGSSATKEPLSDSWTGKEDVVTVGGFGEPKWDHPTVQALAEALANKEALSPDPIVDGILAQAILLARHSDSVGAGQLRALFSEVPPEAILGKLQPGEDRHLALLLGSLGTGHGNAPETALQLATQKPAKPPLEPTSQTGETAAAPDSTVHRLGEPSLSERLDPLDIPPEPGTEAAAGAMGGQAIRGVLGKAGRVAEQVADYTIGQYPDVLAKAAPRDTTSFVERGRLAESTGAKLAEDTMQAFAPAEKAARKLKFQREVTPVDPQDLSKGTIPSWVALADARSQPRNRRERQFQEGMQAGLKVTRDAAIDAGMVRTRMNRQTGQPEIGPIEPAARGTTQRFFGRDAGEVFGKDAERQAMFDVWASQNPNVTVRDPQTGQRRQVTGADIEAEWKSLQGEGKFDIAENRSAIEMFRKYRDIPYTFRGKEVFETSPFRVMERIAREHGARVGVASQFGQSLDLPVRKAIIADLQASGKSPRALAVLQDPTKTGIENAVKAFASQITDTGTVGRNQSLQQAAREWADLLQARTPEHMRLSPNPVWQGVASLERIARTALTAVKSGLYDIGEMFFLAPQYAKSMDVWKAAWQMAKNPREAMRYAHQTAVIDRDMADHNWMEAKNVLRKLEAGLQWSNNLLEHTKGALLVKVSDQMLARWRRGETTINDRQVVRDLLRLPAGMEQALLSGTAGPKVEQLFRRSLARFMSSKVSAAEGSRLAASKPLNTLFRFMRWSTRRMGNQVKNMVAVQRAARDHGWGSKEVAYASWRATKMMLGMTVSGLFSQAMSYALTDLFRGENGFKRWYHALAAHPLAMIGKAFAAQAVLGPAGQIAGALGGDERNFAEKVAGITAPGALALAVKDGLDDVLKGDVAAALYKAASGYGLIPMRREAEGLLDTYVTGKDPQARSDSRFVSGFKRMEGIGNAYGPKNKPDEFYDAIERILSHVDAAQGDDKKALQAAMADIRQALALAPEESVAAAVRGHQRLDSLSLEQRANLAEFGNDDARMMRLYQHDEALRKLARSIGRLEGEHPTPLAEELRLIQEQARLGASDQWGKLADRAVENAAERHAAGEGFGSELDEVAAAMAMHPDQLASVLSERQMKQITNPRLDSTTRARRIAAIFRQRAMARRKQAAKEQAEAARGR